MKHHYQTITQSKLPKALVVGTLSGFEHLFSEALKLKGLDVQTLPTQKLKIEFLSETSYVFVLVDLTQDPEAIVKFIQSLELPHFKISVIIGNHSFSTRDLQNKHQLISAIQAGIKARHFNVRLINIYDVVDKNLTYTPDTAIGKVISEIRKRKVWLLGDDQQFIYPLTIPDVTTAILKIIFSRTSAGKVFDIGGHPMSLLNFSYKVRSHLENDDFQFFTKEDFRFDNHDLKHTIPTNWNDLNWIPDRDITEALRLLLDNLKPVNHDSLSTLEEFPSPASQPQPPQQNQPQFSNAITSILDYPLISKTASPIPEANTTTQLIETPNPSPRPTQNDETVAPIADSISHSVDKPKKEFVIGKKVNKTTSRAPKVTNQASPQPIKRKFTFTKTKEILLLFVLMFFTSLFIFVTSVASTIYFSVQLRTAAKDSNVSEMITNLNHLHTTNSILKPQLQLLKPVTLVLFGSKRSSAFYDAYTVIDRSIDTANDHSQLLVLSSQFGQTIVGTGPSNTKELVMDIQTEVESLYYDLGLITSLLRSNPDIYTIKLFGISQTLHKIDATLLSLQDTLAAVQPIIKSTPDLLGFSSKKTYMVLLQNNAELRPTGGFIGSFALITFEKGKLLDIVVEDVYTADGQLKGYVKPPEPVEQYLGEVSWFLRDSNWNFHFPNSAQSAAWFLQKEMGIDVDGVVAVNMHVVKALLEQTGPISLSDYNETITADNLFERAEYHSEINFFPGSTQKRDFLGSLTRNLKETILTGDDSLWMNVGRSLVGQAQAGELMVYLENGDAQLGMSRLNWTGEVTSVNCFKGEGECVADYLAVVEANVGVNKANYFVNRKISTQSEIVANKINRSVNLSLFNASTQAEWPGGIYKNYVRFYLPLEVESVAITIDEKSVPENEIRVTTEHGKKVIGFLVTVDVQTTSVTSLTYTLPYADQTEYVLYVDKQSGTQGDPFTFELSSNAGHSLKPLVPIDVNTGNLVRDEVSFNQDKLYRIELAK